MSKESLTIDALNSGQRYEIFYTQTIGHHKQTVAMGGFVDVFLGFKLHKQQLLTIWNDQPALDARCITRIEQR